MFEKTITLLQLIISIPYNNNFQSIKKGSLYLHIDCHFDIKAKISLLWQFKLKHLLKQVKTFIKHSVYFISGNLVVNPT